MPPTVNTDKSIAVQFNQQGEIYLTQGKLEEAIASCEQALKIYPNFAPAYKTLGNALQAQGRMEEARHWYAKAIEIEPNFAEVYANLGSICAQQQKWQEAIEFYQKAIALKPDFAGVYRNLAKVFGQINKPAEAQECWYRAFSLEPEKVSAGEHLKMGEAFFRQEKLPEAISCFQRAVKLDPNLAIAYQNLGEALKKQGKMEEATPYYRRAIELNAAHARNGSEGQHTLKAATAAATATNGAIKQQIATAIPPQVQQQIQQIQQQVQPQVQRQQVNSGINVEDPEAYKILAEGYFARGQLEQAIAACKKALQIKPDAGLYKMLGNALQAGGKIDEAKSCYVKAIEINPNFAEAYANYGSICAQQEQWQQAVTAYEKAIDLKPDFAGAFRNFAKLLTQLEKPEAAAEAWYRAYAIDPKSGTAEEHENLAKTLIDQGKLDKGIESYRRAVALNPNAGAAYHELGEILRGQEQWEAAVESYSNAIKNNPDLSWSHNNLAESLVKLERWEEAVNAYRKAIELNPDFSWSHNNLGDALLKLEQWEEAAAAYKKATELNPDFSWSHNYLADALVKLERLEEAVEAYQKSIELNPDHFWAHNNLAESLVKLERWDEAIAAYRRANQIDPNFFWSQSKLGDALLEMERWEEAIAVYRRAAELNRDFAWTYYNIGTAFEKLERWDESIAAYRCAAEIQPDLPWLSQKLADALRMRSQWDLKDAMGLYQRAIHDNPDDVQLYHKALEIAPNDADLYVGLADALGRQGWADGAIVFYQMALQIRPDDKTISGLLEDVLKKKGVIRAITATGDRVPDDGVDYHKLGETLQGEGKIDEAIVAYKRAIEVNPNYFGTHHNLGDLYQQKNKLDEAATSYQKAIERNPGFAWSHHNLGDTLLRQDKLDEAAVAYYKAIEIDQNFAWANYNLGRVLNKQNKLYEALGCYQRANELNPQLFPLDLHILREGLLQSQDAYSRWRAQNCPRESDLRQMAETAKLFNYKPLISVIVPVYNTPTDFLREAIESVRNQVYPNWELCIADDASTDPQIEKILAEYAEKDDRIKVVYRTQNGHISRASNSALEVAEGEFISLLDHDDLLTPDALYEVALMLNSHPEADMIYSDEDKLTADEKLMGPYFKPEWCPDSFLSRMYTCHLGTYRRSIIEEIEGFRAGFEGAQDYDLVLRFTEKTNKIYHIPKVLYHWRMHSGSTASSSEAKPYAYEASIKTLQEAIERRGEPGKVEEVPDYLGHYIVRYKIADYKLVSIIIPTRNLGNVLDQCLESIFTKSLYPNYEVIVIDNGSTEVETTQIIAKWTVKEPNRFTCYPFDIPFNFSKINNYAASKARGDYLLFLNNDTEVITHDWIDAMVEQAQRSSIGAVGVKLLYPDNTIQHVGVVLGVGGVAGHIYLGFPANFPGYFSNVVGMNNLSAVTGACLMCRREVFESVGGFDEELAIAYNDVDLCLKMIEQGYQNIYVPHVSLYHHESKSRGYEDTAEKKSRLQKEADILRRRWQKFIENDPCYSPHLTRTRQDFSIRA